MSRTVGNGWELPRAGQKATKAAEMKKNAENQPDFCLVKEKIMKNIRRPSRRPSRIPDRQFSLGEVMESQDNLEILSCSHIGIKRVPRIYAQETTTWIDKHQRFITIKLLNFV